MCSTRSLSYQSTLCTLAWIFSTRFRKHISSDRPVSALGTECLFLSLNPGVEPFFCGTTLSPSMSGWPVFATSYIGDAISSAAKPSRSRLQPRSLQIDIDRAIYSPLPDIVPVTSTSRLIEDEYIKGGLVGIVEECRSDLGSGCTTLPPSTLSPRLPFPAPPFYPDESHLASDHGNLGTFSAINIIIGKTVGVGVYSVPSSIFVGVGSVGMSILMWVLGAVISYCGLAVYLDLGTAMPRSGGERVYLERIFRRPHMLASCMFMAYVVLLGFSSTYFFMQQTTLPLEMSSSRDRYGAC